MGGHGLGASQHQGVSLQSLITIMLKCSITAIILVQVSALAQLPTARIDSAFPPGLKAGTEAELSLQGTDLEDADRLLFNDAGLTAVHGEGPKFKVTASAAMAPGLYEMRVGGRFGISSSRLIAVGSLPEMIDTPDNASIEKALAVTPPVTINGTAGNDAADYFKFFATKGQPLTLVCAAQRIDSSFNAVLSVLDPAGHELATAHRTTGNDTTIEFTPPQDGEFIAKLHDVVWQTGPTSIYRLTIAPSGTAGAEGTATIPLSGSICDWLPAAPLTELKDPAKILALPTVVASTSPQETLEFTADKNRRVMVDLLSHRLGHPSDWLLQVFKISRDDKGQEKSEKIAEFDDTAAPAGAESFQLASRDPSGGFDCVENTLYRIKLSDRFKTQKPWRLVLRDPLPSFNLVAFWTSPATRAAVVQRWTPFLRIGGSALLQVAVVRRDGFDGPINLHIDGLPAGVSSSDVALPTSVSVASIIVQASPDAKSWNGPIQITGTSGETKATAREAVPRWSVANSAAERLELRLGIGGVMLAVTEAETTPLLIEPAEQKVYETAMAGTIEVPVKFTRNPGHKGFKGEWESVLMGLPGLRQAPVVKPAGDAAEAKLVLDFKRKDGNAFTPGTWSFYASARGTISWQPVEKDPAKDFVEAVYSHPIQVKLEASPVLLTAPPSITVAPGAKAEVPLKLERRYGFAEAVTIELAAPAGIKGLAAAKLTIPKEAAEAKLIIETTTDAPQAIHTCTLNAKCTWNGEEIPWSIQLNVEIKP